MKAIAKSSCQHVTKGIAVVTVVCSDGQFCLKKLFTGLLVTPLLCTTLLAKQRNAWNLPKLVCAKINYNLQLIN